MPVSSLPAGDVPSRSRAASADESEARVGWMNNNVEGRVAVESNRLGAGEIGCSPKSLAWMKRPGSRGRQELAGGLRGDRSSACVCPAQVGPAPKKRPRARGNAGRFGAGRSGRRSDERAEMGTQQPASAQPALEGRRSSCQSAKGGAVVTQARLLLAGECEKARDRRCPS
jgi:hypothetical protein